MTEGQEDDPFDVFDSAGSLYAFCHMQFGPEGSAELLELSISDAEMPTTKKHLERAAQELADVGLPDVAAIVLKHAADIPPPLCPFPDGTANARDWHRRH